MNILYRVPERTDRIDLVVHYCICSSVSGPSGMITDIGELILICIAASGGKRQ